MKCSRILIPCVASAAVMFSLLHAEPPVVAPAPAPGKKIPPTPEQQAVIDADAAVPADQPAMKINVRTALPDGKPNGDFGKPQAAFLDRHGQFLERRKQPMDVLFIGDSITQGWEGKGAAVWKELFEPCRAANFGISGDRTEHVLWRIENGELDGISPKVVVLLIGTNNSAKNTPAEIAAAVAKVVERIHAKIPAARVLLLNLLPRNFEPTDPGGQPNKRRQVMVQTNEILAKMDNGGSIVYLRLWEPFLDEKNVLKKELMPDGLHPNEAGYVIMGKAIKDKLVEMIPQ